MRFTEIHDHINHPQHPLYLKKPLVPFICNGCKESWFGPCYECHTCNFHLHKECAIPSTPTYHHFFQGCEFNFYPKSRTGSRVCDACGRYIKGFMFQCSHSDSHDLHPQCSKLPKTLSDGKKMKLELKQKASSKCSKCHVNSKSDSGPKGWSYVSTCGKYRFHVACIKEIIYEAWEKSYFDQQNDPNAATKTGELSQQVTVPSSSTKIVKDKQRSEMKGTKSNFDQQNDPNAATKTGELSQQVTVPRSSTKIVKDKQRSGMKGTKSKIVAILQVIIAAILGEPITAIVGLVVALGQLIFAI